MICTQHRILSIRKFAIIIICYKQIGSIANRNFFVAGDRLVSDKIVKGPGKP